MINQPSGSPTVIAVFPTIEDARHAIESLERSGIEGSKISLIGRKADEASAEAATQEDMSSRDSEVVGEVAKSAVVGSAIGGTAGFLAGLAAFAIPGIGPVLGTGIWVAGLGGAISGAGVGGVLGGVSAVPMSRDWELARESLQLGRSVVGVHTDHADEMAKAEKSFKAAGALQVQRIVDGERRTEAA